MHPYQSVIDLCNVALSSVRHCVTGTLATEVDRLINEHNEWGVGLELLVDDLMELEIGLDTIQFSSILAAADAMGWGESERIQHLRLSCLR